MYTFALSGPRSQVRSSQQWVIFFSPARTQKEKERRAKGREGKQAELRLDHEHLCLCSLLPLTRAKIVTSRAVELYCIFQSPLETMSAFARFAGSALRPVIAQKTNFAMKSFAAPLNRIVIRSFSGDNSEVIFC